MEDMYPMTKSKYIQMHEDILAICREEGIRLIPGRVPYLEWLRERTFRAPKVFFACHEDFLKLSSACSEKLEHANYDVRVSSKEVSAVAIKRMDMFASNPQELMKYPKGSYFPTITIREFREEEGICFTVLLGERKEMAAEILQNLQQQPYMGGSIYLPEELETFMRTVYDKVPDAGDVVSEYLLFDENLPYLDMVMEAQKRGYLSQEKKQREKQYQEFLKNEKRPAVRAYKIYQDELLSTKL